MEGSLPAKAFLKVFQASGHTVSAGNPIEFTFGADDVRLTLEKLAALWQLALKSAVMFIGVKQSLAKTLNPCKATNSSNTDVHVSVLRRNHKFAIFFENDKIELV